METTDLVRQIVAEVLRKLEAGGSLAAAPAPRLGSFPWVQVYADRSPELERQILPLTTAHYGAGTKLVFNGEEDATCVAADRKTGIVPSLSCSDMAALALGQAASPTAHSVLQSLLRGQKVEVLDFEYRQYEQSAPSALYALYEGYAKTLASFGLVAFREKMPDTRRSQNMLITAQTVEDAVAHSATTLVVPHKATVTPLAWDTAASLGIRMVREG